MPGELKAAYGERRKYDKLVLAEQFIGGGEYTAAVLASAPCRSSRSSRQPSLRLPGQIFRDDTVYRCPSGLSAEREVEIGALVKAFRGIGGGSWGRVDFLMDEAGGQAYLLE